MFNIMRFNCEKRVMFSRAKIDVLI